MKKNTTVLDKETNKEVDIAKYFKSNPTHIRIAKAFDLKCRKCGGKFCSQGLGIEETDDDALISAYIICVECRNKATSLDYILHKKTAMENLKKKLKMVKI